MNFTGYKEKRFFVINNKLIGDVIQYSVSKETDTTSLLDPQPMHYVITLRRKCDTTADREVFNYYNLSSLEFALLRMGKEIVFQNCTIKQFVEEMSETDGLTYQTLVLLAENCTISATDVA